MKSLREDFIKILHNEHGILLIMGLNLILAVILTIYAFINLNPNSAVMQVGYGDIGGYRTGTWVDMLAYPLLALIFGVLHSFLAIRVFHKRGSGMAKFFLITTTCLILGAGLVLFRTLGEG
jgi:hypothetical protein